MQQPWFPDLAEDDLSPDAYQGGELTLPWVLAAYPRGFFPWPAEGEPLTWWCPRVRMVFEPDSMHISRRLARTLRQGRLRVTLDTAFEDVLGRCRDQRGPGREGTWITQDVSRVYGELFERGLGHSVEVWSGERLVGGLYGLALGGTFFGESMVSDERDASKVALASLLAHLEEWGMDMLDCQVPNDHLIRLGGQFVRRSEFLRRLRTSLRQPGRPGPWVVDLELLARRFGGSL